MSILLMVIEDGPWIDGFIPDQDLGAEVSVALQVRNARGAVTWEVAGGALPDGWSLNQLSGVITGTADTAGTFNVAIRVTDDEPASSTQAFEFRVRALPLSIEFTSLPAAVVGTHWAGAVSSTGGVLPKSYSLVSGPSWMSVDPSTGVPSGTPDAAGDDIEVIVGVTDAASAYAEATGAIDVSDPVHVAWSAIDKDSTVTLSNSNYDAESTRNSEGGGLVLSATAKGAVAGKFYAEIGHVQTWTNTAIGAGLRRGNASLGAYAFSEANGWYSTKWGAGGNTRSSWNSGTSTNASTVSHAIPQRMRLAVHFDVANSQVKLWLSPFGSTSWMGGGDPEAGTSPTYSIAYTPGVDSFYLVACPVSGSSTDPASRNKLRLYKQDQWASSAPSGFGVWT